MYQTGTATSATDLVQQLATFLTSAGWTVNKSQAQGSGWWISVQKGTDLFANLVSDPAAGTGTNPGPFIYLAPATGYNGSLAWNAQPGNPSGYTTINKLTAPFTKYYFFEGDDYCHIVIEVSAGVFRHIQFGTVEKACTLTGGQYFMGTNLYYSSTTPSDPSNLANNFPWEAVANTITTYNWVYANAGDGARWFKNYNSFTQGYRISAGVINVSSGATTTLDSRGLSNLLYLRTPNVSNGITPLVPIFMLLEKASALWALVGQPKDIRFVNLTNYLPGDTITIGSDEWLVFPYTSRSTTTADSTSDKSGYYGLAFRKNTA